MMTLAPLLVFGAYIGISGAAHVELDAARMFSSLVVISLVGSALIHVFQALPAIGSACGCLKRVHDFLQLTEPVRAAGSGAHNESSSASLSETEKGIAISLENASFGWSTGNPILHNISLRIKTGSQVAIVGRTGSGKSLLMRSLIGESEQTSGSLVMLGDRAAYCGQVPWLENTSAQETWTQHLSTMGDAKWQAEVRDCCALDDIAILADYRTGTIGSNGVRLSGGQRQRLVCNPPPCSIATSTLRLHCFHDSLQALARAVAAKKRVVLLDDVFSALDRATRQIVSTRLLGPSGLFQRLGTTVIYTTHDSACNLKPGEPTWLAN